MDVRPRPIPGGKGLAKESKKVEDEEVGRKRKKARYEVDAEALLQDDMFMSVEDFQMQRVILPFLEDDEYYEEEEVEDDGDKGEGADGDEEEDGEELVEEGPVEDEEEGPELCGRECYVFNARLPRDKDDNCCVHCKLYLTLQCPHLDDFMDEVDSLDPDD